MSQLFSGKDSFYNPIQCVADDLYSIISQFVVWAKKISGSFTTTTNTKP